MLLRFPLAALAGLLACGLPLWPIPYHQVSMPAALAGVGAARVMQRTRGRDSTRTGRGSRRR